MWFIAETGAYVFKYSCIGAHPVWWGWVPCWVGRGTHYTHQFLLSVGVALIVYYIFSVLVSRGSSNKNEQFLLEADAFLIWQVQSPFLVLISFTLPVVLGTTLALLGVCFLKVLTSAVCFGSMFSSDATSTFFCCCWILCNWLHFLLNPVSIASFLLVSRSAYTLPYLLVYRTTFFSLEFSCF